MAQYILIIDRDYKPTERLTMVFRLFQRCILFVMLLFVLHSGVSYAAIVPVEDSVSLLIDVSKHRLHVYLNEEIVYSFPIATGKGRLTPIGEFSIANKIAKPWYVRKNIPGGDRRNPLGTHWLGLDVPGTGGYTYGIHGTNNPASIGYSVSSGCIRMRNRDVEWLYNHIPVGTKVLIIDKKK